MKTNYTIQPIHYSPFNCDHCNKPLPYKAETPHELNAITLADGYAFSSFHLACYPLWLEKIGATGKDADLSSPDRFPWAGPRC